MYYPGLKVKLGVIAQLEQFLGYAGFIWGGKYGNLGKLIAVLSLCSVLANLWVSGSTSDGAFSKTGVLKHCLKIWFLWARKAIV